MTIETDRNGQGRERTPEEIQSEIGQSRAVAHQDLKAIGEKFTPEQLKENAKGILSDAKKEGATMIRETKDSAMGSLRSARDQAMDTASSVAHDIGGRARDLGYTTADYARRAGTATGDFVTTNAIPLSLIGLGVGWLALSMRRQTTVRYVDEDLDYGYDYPGFEEDYYASDEGDDLGGSRSRVSAARARAGELTQEARGRAGNLAHTARERVGAVAGGARERVGAVAEGARERVGAVAEGARERVGQLTERANQGIGMARERVTSAASQLSQRGTELSHEARQRLQRAQLRTRDFADENPLALGAIAIAAGVGVGLLLPATQPENRLMGEARDRLIGDARGILHEARETGSRVGQTARDAAQELRSAVGESRISH